ncbi:CCER1 protein, partial [Atractosteus spatula]|nr:CCER1 protein [Atractosteus spatula]
MCGKGLMCQWRVLGGRADSHAEKSQAKHGDDSSRRASGRHRWHKSGRRPSYQGKRGRAPGHPQRYRRKGRPASWPPGAVSLRPVNVKGNRAPGMRAPRNTNQFLMHEKYQLLHMRSDSVGTDSGSDCEMDFTDMDSYLGVLENARGALMDSPDLSPPPSAGLSPRQLAKRQQRPFFGFGDIHQEESMQYFPSEDDVLQSEDFMQKDFIEFFNAVS